LGRETEWITQTNGHYWFNRTPTFWFDVDLFEACLREARQLGQNEDTRERVIERLKKAVDLYGGDFAENLLAGEWHTARSQRLCQGYLEALLTLGYLYIGAGQDEQAIALFRRAVEKEPYLEEAHLELIRSYARRNQRGQALRQYAVLTSVLAELDATPSPEATALIEGVRHGSRF
jgi:DNA-binding SARP family transcriptional activator